MADTVPLLQSFPPPAYAKLSPKEIDKAIHDFLKKLQQVSSSIWTPTGNKQNILDQLDPAVHTIAYIIGLNAQRTNRARADDVYQRCIIFFSTFDPIQVRWVGVDYWSPVLEWFFEYTAQNQITDLTPISTALLRLDPSGGTFTSYHYHFVELCARLQVPSQALPILDKDIFAIAQDPPKHIPEELLSDQHALSNAYINPKNGFSQRLSPENLLLYYLFGANAYLGLRKYSRARLFLESVLLYPSQQHAASSLQAEAYKKWLLLGLVAQGRVYPQPRTLDQQVAKTVKATCKAYEALAEDFERRDYKKYLAEVEVGRALWSEDGNGGLVREAADALLRYRVVDLQRTYSALPISRVAAHLDMSADSTLQLVTNMITASHLRASLSTGDAEAGTAVLRFHPLAATGPPDALDDTLGAQTQRIEALIVHIRDADRRLQLTKEFVEHQRRVKRAGSGPDGDLADQMDLTWDAPSASMPENEADEDIMAA
nr:cop9 signalosome complex subunit 3 [Quercus suber]